MDGLRLHIDQAAVRRLFEEAAATPKQARTAVRRAFRRTQTHIKNDAAKQAAASLGARQTAIKRRFVTPAPDETQMEVWVGTWRIPAEKLGGAARQTRAGVSVGRRKFPGAFLWRARGWVMIRASSKHIGLYPGLRRSSGGRLPIQRVRVDVEREVTIHFSSAGRGYEEFFMRRLQQELRYEVEKAAGKIGGKK